MHLIFCYWLFHLLSLFILFKVHVVLRYLTFLCELTLCTLRPSITLVSNAIRTEGCTVDPRLFLLVSLGGCGGSGVEICAPSFLVPYLRECTSAPCCREPPL